jgi:hypothetical protein
MQSVRCGEVAYLGGTVKGIRSSPLDRAPEIGKVQPRPTATARGPTQTTYPMFPKHQKEVRRHKAISRRLGARIVVCTHRGALSRGGESSIVSLFLPAQNLARPLHRIDFYIVYRLSCENNCSGVSCRLTPRSTRTHRGRLHRCSSSTPVRPRWAG